MHYKLTFAGVVLILTGCTAVSTTGTDNRPLPQRSVCASADKACAHTGQRKIPAENMYSHLFPSLAFIVA